MTGPESWLTTEQAAEKLGFSLPYVVALLNSSDFKGQFIRCGDGIFRVQSASVEAWMTKNGVNFPTSEEDLALLREPTPSEFFDDEGLDMPIVDESDYKEILKSRQEMFSNRPKHQRKDER
jgi:excisionase family DNA binding protein